MLQAQLRALPTLQLGQLSSGLGQLQAGFSGLARVMSWRRSFGSGDVGWLVWRRGHSSVVEGPQCGGRGAVACKNPAEHSGGTAVCMLHATRGGSTPAALHQLAAPEKTALDGHQARRLELETTANNHKSHTTNSQQGARNTD